MLDITSQVRLSNFKIYLKKSLLILLLLQVILYSAVQNTTIWLEAYSEQGRQLVLSAWNSPRLTQIQDIAKNTISSLLDFIRQLSSKIVQCASYNTVFNRVSTFVSTECKYYIKCS